MKSITEIKNLSGKKIILRVDFNVPLVNGKVVDDFRIKKALPTILYLQKKKAKIVIISHRSDDKGSFSPIVSTIKKYLINFTFIENSIFSDETENKIKNLKDGEIVLLENLRKDEGEKKNSPSFARALSRYGEIYVNEAFPECHREYASIVGIVKHLPSYAGFQLIEEVKALTKVFTPTHPFLFILGGAKFETKIPLIKKFLKKADNIFIGGAIANDFFKSKGLNTGVALVSDNLTIIKPFIRQKNIILPSDIIVSDGKSSKCIKIDEVKDGEDIVDAGAETITKLKELIKNAKFILWNGPLGKYEDGYDKSTKELLKEISKSESYSIIGGGDTVALVSKLKIEDKLGFVSTGGGATLDFLAKGTLPGIRALK